MTRTRSPYPSTARRKVSVEAAAALLARRYYRNANTEVMGGALYLHGNEIARLSPSGVLEITLARWNTVTTRERLSALPGVSVSTRRGTAYLNGQPWGGEWTAVAA